MEQMIHTRQEVHAAEFIRENGPGIRRKPEEIYDNSLVNNLEKRGFLKEFWGSENYRR